MTLDEAISLYLVNIRAIGLSPFTAKAYAWALGQFRRWSDDLGVVQVQDVDRELVFQFQANLAHRTNRFGRPLSAKTQHQMLQALKSFFALLVRRGELLADPARALVLPRLRKKEFPHDIPTVHEMVRILESVRTRRPTGLRNRAILELLYATALRIGELTGLTLADVDFSEGTVTVREGKGQASRIVPLGDEAGQWVSRYITQARPILVRNRHSERLFVTWYGKPLCGEGLRTVLRDLARKARVFKRLTPHTFRHACATHMLARGADVRALQMLLGHRQLSTTALYTHLDIRNLKRAHRRYHPRARPKTGLPSQPPV